MNQAVEQFRSKMKAIGWDEADIERRIKFEADNELRRRKSLLIDELCNAFRSMDIADLLKLKGGEQ